jgi:hypothetical protein
MDFYFTFGQGHCTTSGIPMKDHWVRVRADNAEIARDTFIQYFTKERMPAPDKWAFQYSEEDFNKEMYPLGEYAFIQG